MKKIFVLILAAMLIVASSNIQAQTQVSFGARAGLNIANFSFDPDVATGVTKSSRTGFKFGGALEVGFETCSGRIQLSLYCKKLDLFVSRQEYRDYLQL